jgi:hypothetical protein
VAPLTTRIVRAAFMRVREVPLMKRLPFGRHNAEWIPIADDAEMVDVNELPGLARLLLPDDPADPLPLLG